MTFSTMGKALAAVLVLLAPAASTFGSFELSLTEHDSGNTAIVAQPGQTFSVDLLVADPCVQVWTGLVASSNGIVAITGGGFESPWTNLVGLPYGALDPSKDVDAFIPLGQKDSWVPRIAIIELTVNALAAPGVYRIDLPESFVQPSYEVLGVVQLDPAPGVTLTVLPEPANLLLLGAGLLFIRRR